MTQLNLKLKPLLLAIGVLLSPGVGSAQSLPISSEIGTIGQFTHGRFEARIQFAAGDGVVSTFFLWKDGSEMADVFWNEVDIEKLGADCNGYSSNAFYGLPQVVHEEHLDAEADLCAGYHTHTMEWTPEAIVWYLDGVELRRVTGEDVAAYNDNAPEGMQMRFNLWVGRADFGGILDPAILPVHQFISYAQFSSYTPGAGDDGGDFTLLWRESFEDGIGNDWLRGSWDSPFGNSRHSPQNVDVQDGVAVLSLTPSGTTGFDGVVPADPMDLPSFKDGVLTEVPAPAPGPDMPVTPGGTTGTPVTPAPPGGTPGTPAVPGEPGGTPGTPVTPGTDPVEMPGVTPVATPVDPGAGVPAPVTPSVDPTTTEAATASSDSGGCTLQPSRPSMTWPMGSLALLGLGLLINRRRRNV